MNPPDRPPDIAASTRSNIAAPSILELNGVEDDGATSISSRFCSRGEIGEETAALQLPHRQSICKRTRSKFSSLSYMDDDILAVPLHVVKKRGRWNTLVSMNNVPLLPPSTTIAATTTTTSVKTTIVATVKEGAWSKNDAHRNESVPLVDLPGNVITSAVEIKGDDTTATTAITTPQDFFRDVEDVIGRHIRSGRGRGRGRGRGGRSGGVEHLIHWKGISKDEDVANLCDNAMDVAAEFTKRETLTAKQRESIKTSNDNGVEGDVSMDSSAREEEETQNMTTALIGQPILQQQSISKCEHASCGLSAYGLKADLMHPLQACLDEGKEEFGFGDAPSSTTMTSDATAGMNVAAPATNGEKLVAGSVASKGKKWSVRTSLSSSVSRQHRTARSNNGYSSPLPPPFPPSTATSTHPSNNSATLAPNSLNNDVAKVVVEGEDTTLPLSKRIGIPAPQPPPAIDNDDGEDTRDDEAVNTLVSLHRMYRLTVNDDHANDNIVGRDLDVTEEGDGNVNRLAPSNSLRGGTEDVLERQYAIARSTTTSANPNKSSGDESSEVMRLQQELENMRSERDLAVIELTHFKAGFDGVATDRNDDHERTSEIAASMEPSTLRGEVLDVEFLAMRADMKASERKLLEALTRIAVMSAEKIALVSRIASALEDDMASVLRTKDDALNEAESAIASLKASINNFNDPTSSVVAIDSFAGNNARKVSLDEVGNLPLIAATKGNERVTNGAMTNDMSISRSGRESNNSCPKSAMIQPRFSSTSSCSSIGSGRVSFDRSTSFGKLPKFDLFKENFGNHKMTLKQKSGKRKRSVKLSFGGDGNVYSDGDSPSNSSLCTQTSGGGSSCDGSEGRTRTKQNYSSVSGKCNGKSYSLDNFDDVKLY